MYNAGCPDVMASGTPPDPTITSCCEFYGCLDPNATNYTPTWPDNYGNPVKTTGCPRWKGMGTFVGDPNETCCCEYPLDCENNPVDGCWTCHASATSQQPSMNSCLQMPGSWFALYPWAMSYNTQLDCFNNITTTNDCQEAWASTCYAPDGSLCMSGGNCGCPPGENWNPWPDCACQLPSIAILQPKKIEPTQIEPIQQPPKLQEGLQIKGKLLDKIRMASLAGIKNKK